MEEIWLDIPGYEGLYQVSNKGRVKSLSRTIKTKGSSFRVSKEIVLRPNKDADNYQIVTLRKNNEPRTLKIHRLELLAFRGAPPEGEECGLHLDDNTANNYLENLKWGSASENMRQAFDRGRKYSPKYWKGKTGADNATSKKIIQMDLSDNKLGEFTGIYEASRQTKVNRSCISACCLGNKTVAGGFKWKYAV